MLSVKKARKLLGDECPMTDAEIEAMLAQFRLIAYIAFDSVEIRSSDEAAA